MVTWIKLNDGTWGIRGDGLSPGQTVTVTKRDGTSSRVVVGSIVSTENGTTTAKVSRPYRPRNWRPCGYPGCNPHHCDECDGKGAGGSY